MIAIVGGDGAGKSTVIDTLHTLLSQSFKETRVHMGKPGWSWSTLAIRGILKIGQLLGLYPLEASFRETLEQNSPLSPGYPWLVREVCRAHDRYWTYIRARRFASNGGLVLFDRFPLPEIQLMDGPQTARFVRESSNRPPSRQFMRPLPTSRFAKFLMEREESYYRQIAFPDVVIILRVDPETAVRRKPDDDAIAVRERAAEIWGINWREMNVHVVDGRSSRNAVASEIVSLIWSEL